MIEPCSRTLDQLQASLLHYCVPVDWNFGMADKNVCLKDRFTDSFLTSIDDLRVGCGGLEPVQMARFDGGSTKRCS